VIRAIVEYIAVAPGSTAVKGQSERGRTSPMKRKTGTTMRRSPRSPLKIMTIRSLEIDVFRVYSGTLKLGQNRCSSPRRIAMSAFGRILQHARRRPIEIKESARRRRRGGRLKDVTRATRCRIREVIILEEDGVSEARKSPVAGGAKTKVRPGEDGSGLQRWQGRSLRFACTPTRNRHRPSSRAWAKTASGD